MSSSRIKGLRLDGAPLEDLLGELKRRLLAKQVFTKSKPVIQLGSELLDALAGALDIHDNRFSRKYLIDLYGCFFRWLEPVQLPIKGQTFLEAGCGHLNPGAFLFLLLMLGAKRGIGVDLGGIQDLGRAVKALAECAAFLLLDPAGLVGDHFPAREEMLRNIASFDLAKLRNGDADGVDPERLAIKKESILNLSLMDGEVDTVLSNAFLEHIPEMEQAARELARVTRKGGLGVHNIDATDHRHYDDPSIHPLAFLCEEPGEELLYTCNRLRLTRFPEIFSRCGFELVAFHVWQKIEVPEDLRARFAEPWRSAPREELEMTHAQMVLRRL